MKNIVVDIRVPYDKKGEIIKKLSKLIKDKVAKAKLLPPDAFGYNEIILEVLDDKILRELRKLRIKNAKILSH
ncbi:hypothetical protein PFDSM3638_05210 [Pyrococcus furiosus DSM 3638]|uniref:Uncharacterized protein n=3 Tax=Pyrococcus furiosus TaxID=2261 RepID=Q8U215_PYRFU|nr:MULTISPECIES: hypothetical protein [Pyrococcus]AAL81161.1 hypothetical protein PF1037 [Pyrococcus furiosus DSM 3638]AFN03833.1 hypothetical protein PFC_04420 [Pyrococcus furiosus COM1]MDK2868838.1 hypothetical protein [Pyrococcus sp.]QEK78699.1 hypothetical protein PFDSM3638_05210 [Pyrococcus furiosus DSM 3638]